MRYLVTGFLIKKAPLITVAVVALFMGLGAHPAVAAETDPTQAPEDTVSTGTEDTHDSAFEEFQERFRTRYFKIGIFVRTNFDFQRERTDQSSDGFELSRARLTITGEFDQGYGYLLQADFQATPVINDAAGLIDLPGTNVAQIGQFKATFSREFLRNSADGDFVVIARAVDELAPKRQLGLESRGSIASDAFSYAVGIFNGNGKEARNDNDEFLYVARFEFSGKPIRFRLLPVGILHREAAEDKFEIGINVAYSYDSDVEIGDLIEHFNGKRLLVGADTRMIRGRVSGAMEFIYSDLEPRAGASSNPYGYHITAGYSLTPQSQVLARIDKFEADGVGEDSENLFLGYSHRPTTYTRFQINVAMPTDVAEFDKYRILLSGQLKF